MWYYVGVLKDSTPNRVAEDRAVLPLPISSTQFFPTTEYNVIPRYHYDYRRGLPKTGGGIVTIE